MASVVNTRRCDYYRRLVDGYADIAATLTRLCGQHAPWHWSPVTVEQQSLDTLKCCLTTAPVLSTFDLGRLPTNWRSSTLDGGASQ
jgi:hypothetical protein